jgi:hypothetical protein
MTAYNQNYLIAMLLLVAALTCVFFAVDSKEDKEILNAFSKANAAIPEWVEVKQEDKGDNSTIANIRYGVGGKTCNSTIFIVDGKLINETNKSCDF